MELLAQLTDGENEIYFLIILDLIFIGFFVLFFFYLKRTYFGQLNVLWRHL